MEHLTPPARLRHTDEEMRAAYSAACTAERWATDDLQYTSEGSLAWACFKAGYELSASLSGPLVEDTLFMAMQHRLDSRWATNQRYLHNAEPGSISREKASTALTEISLLRQALTTALTEISLLQQALTAVRLRKESRQTTARPSELVQIGWLGPYGIVPGGMDNTPAENWQPIYTKRERSPSDQVSPAQLPLGTITAHTLAATMRWLWPVMDALMEEEIKTWTDQDLLEAHCCDYVRDKALSLHATLARAATIPELVSEQTASEPGFQARVGAWMQETFGPDVSEDYQERGFRFGEEAIELLQANGTSKQDVLKLVDYVFGRPIGEFHQEVGGTLVTLAALCHARGLDMAQAGDTEQRRCEQPEVRARIQAKQAAKRALMLATPLPGSVDEPLV
jgi:hypothetical protein